MICGRNSLNYIQPKNVSTASKMSCKKNPLPRNIIKIKIADNPKDIIIKFSDKETLLKTLHELLDI